MEIILYALGVLCTLALFCGAILGFASFHFKPAEENGRLVDQINAIMPQTQCGHCGYPGCRPYAKAIVQGDAINKCPPGGQQTINKLAAVLNIEPITLDIETEHDFVTKVAFIREAECIGCTKCIQACPFDAILGAAKQMHTVIAQECTGCDLCVEPCPVSCIEMRPINSAITL